jgi:hypothetical protein
MMFAFYEKYCESLGREDLIRAIRSVVSHILARQLLFVPTFKYAEEWTVQRKDEWNRAKKLQQEGAGINKQQRKLIILRGVAARK